MQYRSGSEFKAILEPDFSGSVPATAWWEGDDIWTSFSRAGGQTWETPVLVSPSGEQNKQCDLVISGTGNRHFVYSNNNTSTSLWEIHYRRAHLDWQ